MGITFSGLSFAYGDNTSVIHNTQCPKSVLKKKYNSIFYHAYREAVAMDKMLTVHVRSENNPVDLEIKVLGGGAKRNGLISHLWHDLI